MKLIKTILCIAATGMLMTTATAQDHEVGLFVGAAIYQGDLTAPALTLSETKPGFGGLYRYYFNPRLNFKGSLYTGWISGDDKNHPEDGREKRNLSFRSNVTELSLQMELNILPYISGSQKYKFAPYVFGGVAGFYFNPKTDDAAGNTIALQPLGTEGQNLPGGDPYSLYQFAIPYGIGVKYNLGKLWNLGFEVGQRKLFTDFLDDVSDDYPDMDALEQRDPKAAELSSRAPELGLNRHTEGAQRGDPNDMDMYVFVGFTLTKTFRKYSCKDF
ncbi:MAG: DUF6089 family protein [Bacteroidia bacterium]